MELEEAIKHCEEVAEEQVKLCKRYDDASGYSRSHNETIRVDDAKKCEKCADEHEQLAEWLKDYKRLLDQEPCEDAISRQATVEFLRNHAKDFEDARCRMAFKTASSLVENPNNIPITIPTTKWIPASERLPKQNEYVGNVCKYYLVQNEFGDMLVATYTNNGWIPINTMQALEYDVIAWCSLPEPYQEE